MATQTARLLLLSALLISLVSNMVARAADAPLSPKELYLKYHQELFSAKGVEELFPYFSKSAVGKVKETPEQSRPPMFEMIKAMTPHSVTVDGEKITGEKAVLTLHGANESEQPGIS